MSTYEEHVDALEQAQGVSSETVEIAQDAISFIAALHGLYVDQGVLNEDAQVDLGVLENLTDAYHGELAAAAIFLAEDSFQGAPEVLRGLSDAMEDPEGVVPVVVRKGFGRLAGRIEQTRKMKEVAMQALIEAQGAEKG